MAVVVTLPDLVPPMQAVLLKCPLTPTRLNDFNLTAQANSNRAAHGQPLLDPNRPNLKAIKEPTEAR